MSFEHPVKDVARIASRQRIAQLYQRLKKLSASVELKQLQNSLKSSLSCQALATLHPQERRASNFEGSAWCMLSCFFSQPYLVRLSSSFPGKCNGGFSARRTRSTASLRCLAT